MKSTRTPFARPLPIRHHSSGPACMRWPAHAARRSTRPASSTCKVCTASTAPWQSCSGSRWEPLSAFRSSAEGQVATLTPRLDSSRQAHTSDALELHTDFSTMPRPPAVTILHVVRAHPLGPGYARTGVCLARDIVSAGAALRGCLSEIPFPFADPGADRRALLSPLVEVDAPRCTATVRYHADRLRDGFSALGRLPTEHELQALADFRALVAMNRRDFALATGDLLLINNRTVLHGRSASPLVIHPTRRDGRLVKTVFLTDLTPTVGMPA